MEEEPLHRIPFHRPGYSGYANYHNYPNYPNYPNYQPGPYRQRVRDFDMRRDRSDSQRRHYSRSKSRSREK